MKHLPLLILLMVGNIFSATYFVRPTGSDSNNGLSTNSAWQTLAKVSSTSFTALDKILFEGGKSFSGFLQASSSGSAAGNITYSSYGSGRAIINSANALGFDANGKEHLTISNLAFQGSGRLVNGTVGMNFTSSGWDHGIRLVKLDVSGYGSYGIMFYGDEIAGKGTRNLLIQDCVVHDNRDTGIFFGGYWYNNLRRSTQTYAHSNVTIRGCDMYRNSGYNHNNHSGSGIMLWNCSDSLIEYCTAWSNGFEAFNNTGGGGPIGIWCWDSLRVTIQYCESHHNRCLTSHDGGGFDFDGGSRDCLMQFNYSHDNDGAGYLFAQFVGSPWELENCTVRYCLSVNDGVDNLGGIAFWNGMSTSWLRNNLVYNNTIYSKHNPAFIINYTDAQNNRIFNNILTTSNRTIVFAPNPTGYSLQGNLYHDVALGFRTSGVGGTIYNSLSSWQSGLGWETTGGLNADPMFLLPRYGRTLDNPLYLTTLTNFKVKSNSPAIDSGLNLSSYGIVPGTRDFYGTSLYQRTSADKGFFEHPFLSLTPNPQTNSSLPKESKEIYASPNPLRLGTAESMVFTITKKEKDGQSIPSNEWSLEIYTLTGSLVRSFPTADINSQFRWNGSNSRGKTVSTGTYLAILKRNGKGIGMNPLKIGIVK